MAYEIFMPKMSTSMTEGEVVSFIKNVGDQIQEGYPIMEIMTDKVSQEMEAGASGTIAKYFVTEGDVVQVGVTIGIILSDGETLPDKFIDYKI